MPQPVVPFAQRRRIVLMLGAASALGGVPPLLLSSAAQAASPSPLERLSALLNLVARDTFAGVAAFAVPGNDLYSLAQGVSTLQPGAVAAKSDAFLVFMFDNFLALPGAGELATALGAPFRGIKVPQSDGKLADLGALVTEFVAAADSLPLGFLVALLLNALALVVQPASAVGLFLTPFPRLSWKHKAQVFELLELPGSDAIRMVAERLKEPLTQTLVGYVQLVATGVLAFAGSAAYHEWYALDATTRRLKLRPVGWTLSKYQPYGPVEGWDEFRGYYQGRRSANDA
jgi:hypothetical protein